MAEAQPHEKVISPDKEKPRKKEPKKVFYNLLVDKYDLEYGDIPLFPNDFTQCAVAAFFGAHKTLKKMINTPSNDLDTLSIGNRTPLHFVAMGGDLDCVKILLEVGLDIRAVDAFGHTPLSLAGKYGHAHIVEKMLKAEHEERAKESRSRASSAGSKSEAGKDRSRSRTGSLMNTALEKLNK